MFWTNDRVPGTNNTVRFITVAVLLGAALLALAPASASAAFIQFVGTAHELPADAAPESASLLLLGCGLAGTARLARRAHPRRQPQ